MPSPDDQSVPRVLTTEPTSKEGMACDRLVIAVPSPEDQWVQAATMSGHALTAHTRDDGRIVVITPRIDPGQPVDTGRVLEGIRRQYDRNRRPA